jgi:hypothetical protein
VTTKLGQIEIKSRSKWNRETKNIHRAGSFSTQLSARLGALLKVLATTISAFFGSNSREA